MKYIRSFIIIVFFVCVIITTNTAQNSTANIITIKPAQPKVGELVQIQLSYNTQNLKASTYLYITEDSRDIKFVNVHYLGTTESSSGDTLVNIYFTLRPLRSGVVKIPAIIENDTVSIFVPNLYVKSMISADNTTTILNFAEFPWLSLLHFLLIIFTGILFIYITTKAVQKKYSDIKKQYYILTNKYNAHRCIFSAKHLLLALTKMSTSKFRQQPINTYTSYVQMVLIIRKRIGFLFGKHSQSFTHKELQQVLFGVLLYAKVKISRKKIELFFIAASEALYGNMEHDIMLRRTHSQLLLDIMRASVCYEKKERLSADIAVKSVLNRVQVKQ